MKKLLSLLFVLILLLSCFGTSFAADGPSAVEDRAKVLGAEDELYLSEQIGALTEAYEPDIVLFTVKSASEKNLKKEAEKLIRERESDNALVLAAEASSGRYYIAAEGTAADVFDAETLSLWAEECYFPLYFEEKCFAEGMDDFLFNAAERLADYSSQAECAVLDAWVKAAGGSRVQVTVKVLLTNYSDESVPVKELLQGTLRCGDTVVAGRTDFKYKNVYSLEELEGTVSFEAEASCLKDAEVFLVCRAQKIPITEIRDERTEKQKKEASPTPSPVPTGLDKNGSYWTKEDVAAYIRQFGKLPPNYITKSQAQNLGWDSSSGNLWKVAPGKSIGGDRFGNYEGVLPKGSYTECDIDYHGGYRDSKRLVFCKSGGEWHIYYTEDHYETFEEVK